MKVRPLLLSILCTSVVASCGDGGEAAEGIEIDPRVLVDFADKVVVPTYSLLATRAAALETAVSALAAAPDTAKLQAAQAAWRAARVPWEQSEAFLFGPVDANGYDPALDSWPVNRTDLEVVLSGAGALDDARIASLADELRGFHTIEYLLFGDGGTRSVEELDARRLEYVVATTRHLRGTADALAASWTAGTGGGPSFRDVFVTAGDAGNAAYPSREAAAQEILIGVATILDEVANGKIADPYDRRDAELVESQFSWNSIDDFTNNLLSVRNAWRGDCEVCGTQGRGIDELIRSNDPALADRVDSGIAAAIAALGEIPPPFRAAILDDAARVKIAAAQVAIRDVADLLAEEAVPLIQP